MESILVVRFSSLGDVILTSPIVRQLQRTYPSAIVDVAVASRFAEVYEHNPRVRRVWAVDPSPTIDNIDADAVRLSMHESVPGRQYDLVVDLQNNVRSASFRHGLGRSVVRAPKFRAQKLAMVWLKQRPSIVTPIVERYRQPLLHLPLVLDTDGLEVWTPQERAAGAYHSRRSTPERSHREGPLRVAIAPGAHHATKRWPVARFADVITQLTGQGAQVSLLGSAADQAVCDAIVSAAGVEVHRADGASSLFETISVLDTCDVLITNDSGVMHVGAARQIPTIALFGSTVPELGFGPFGVQHTIVQHDVACRPCSHIGRARCPKGHFLCMEGITTEQVLSAVARMC